MVRRYKSNIMLAISKENQQKVTKIRASGAHPRTGGTGELLKSYSRDTSREEKTGGRAKDVWESIGGAASTLGGALALKRRARVARTERSWRGRSRGRGKRANDSRRVRRRRAAARIGQTCGGGGGGTPRVGTQSTAPHLRRRQRQPCVAKRRSGVAAAAAAERRV